jgi:hypothetical protein
VVAVGLECRLVVRPRVLLPAPRPGEVLLIVQQGSHFDQRACQRVAVIWHLAEVGNQSLVDGQGVRVRLRG